MIQRGNWNPIAEKPRSQFLVKKEPNSWNHLYFQQNIHFWTKFCKSRMILKLGISRKKALECVFWSDLFWSDEYMFSWWKLINCSFWSNVSWDYVERQNLAFKKSIKGLKLTRIITDWDTVRLLDKVHIFVIIFQFLSSQERFRIEILWAIHNQFTFKLLINCRLKIKATIFPVLWF